MKHNSTVSKRPVRTSGKLVPQKSILQPEQVVRELLVEENVPKLAVEVVILIVRNFQYSTFYPEGVAKIIIERVPGQLNIPTLKIPSVEQSPPFELVRIILSSDTNRTHEDRQEHCSKISLHAASMEELA